MNYFLRLNRSDNCGVSFYRPESFSRPLHCTLPRYSMLLITLFVAAAAFVWWAVYASRGSLLVGCSAFIAFGYALGPELASVDVGPITLTADRVMLAALAAAFCVQWRLGKLTTRAVTGVDWVLFALVAYLTIRCAFTTPPDVPRPGAGAWWRIIASFWAPTVLYFVAKNADLNERSWRWMLAGLTVLGGYLAVTALAEITQQWWAVFPRYIADPTLGTHFGRARGPALMSASLGVFLTVCGWAAWTLWPRVNRPLQLSIVVLLAMMAAEVFFTYTRSTWIGLAAGAAVVPFLQWDRKWRPLLMSGIAIAGVVGVVMLGAKVTDLGRKDADGSAKHSVQQRASFFYLSMQMFQDAPLVGCGVGRFYDCKLPYLSDRSQSLELESLRNLDHHNTFLSVLTETGAIGLLLFVGVLVAWGKTAWALHRSQSCPQWMRAHGVFSIATLIAYVASALFHDLTLSHQIHWLLFLAAGVSSGLAAELRCEAAIRSTEANANRTFATRRSATVC